MPPYVGPSALARALGVSPQAVNQAAKRGRITPREDGTYDLPATLAIWTRTAGGTGADNGRRGGGPGKAGNGHGGGGGEGPGGPDYYLGRAVRERYLAMLAKLDYEERIGQLVRADEVRAQAFAAGRKLRERLTTMADRIATLVAGTRDRAKCHRLIAQEVNRALDELASDEATQ